jgi:hypothetical protein
MHRCGLEILFSSPQLLSVIADGAIIRPDHPTDNSPDRHFWTKGDRLRRALRQTISAVGASCAAWFTTTTKYIAQSASENSRAASAE